MPTYSPSNSSMLRDFVAAHRSQLDMLNIPEPLLEGLKQQLDAAYVTQVNNEGDVFLDIENLTLFMQQSRCSLLVNAAVAAAVEYGAMMVIPHVVSWEMVRGQGLIEALQNLNTGILQLIWQGLQPLQLAPIEGGEDLVNAVAGHPALWSRVILYRSSSTGTVRAALPAPPYLPQCDENCTAEADSTGPFPFCYQQPALGPIDVSLVYVSSECVAMMQNKSTFYLPSIDLVPSYQCSDGKTRAARFVALLHGTDQVPASAAAMVKQIYAEFVQQMHVVRQAALERQAQHIDVVETRKLTQEDGETESTADNSVYRVYTDADDPMELKHPVAGLEANSSHFQLVDSIEEADIVYSYSSVFAPNSSARECMISNKTLLVNQFPFEGAFVQKDHLAREILKQHGLPRPPWALETYDLDVHLTEFIGAALFAAENDPKQPLWIVKPAAGTQSKGHVVTRSLAQLLRLLDAVGGGRVAQRYIENPVCIDGRKVDCRCLVFMTSGVVNPTLYMHNTVYFRIANKAHVVATARDLTDHESVLTATHLLDASSRSSVDKLRKLPTARDTIAQLERNYPGSFDWEASILPKIQVMIRELFNGMTTAYPAMGKSKQSRALYGVDVMFQIDYGGNEGSLSIITPKLTEVTFCPANNAVCEAYVRDNELFRLYNKDIFECLFMEKVSERITRLQ